MTRKHVWRIQPPPWLGATVHRTLQEGRSDTNVLSRLISARRAIEAREPEVVRLANLIRGTRESTQ
jgi:hypothetical protein